MRANTRKILLALALLVIAWGGMWVVVANPLNLFVPRSPRFSLDKFKAIQVGSRIEDAIKLLGKPVVVQDKDRFDPECPTCVAYCFMGDPPSWVVGFQEAWLIVDRQGKVCRVFLNREP